VGRIIKADVVKNEALSVLQTDEAKRAAELVVTAEAAAERIAETARDQVVDLAVAMARRIIRREVELDGRVLGDIYQQALAAARGLERATVRVHPEDRAACPIDEAAASLGFECLDDAEVGRGGCVVMAGAQQVDASIETLLGCFEKAMKDSTDE
jgi:flagellar biosynthesis/type III secretory pathway protein FliH